ncbi:uncharacterized protein LOC125016449 [Mugil cephalus]|uniref:uncharacterized protein LOC125016449 n=1 Tax=Mugil cephalus TaxID=48193 RepID=UPI001FB613FB|nr:uncharacterized protein LOC125016449 [Mugil cephalus]
MAEFYVQFLSLILFIVASQCRADSTVTETVSTFKEEDVTLSCFNKSQTEPGQRIRWMRYDADAEKPRDIFVWPKKAQDGPQLNERVDGNGQGQLFLREIQMSDDGLYKCEVWEGWDVLLVKEVSLKVKACKVLQTVKAVPGTDVKLSLPVNITSRAFNISWGMVKGDKAVPIESERIEINGTSLAIRSVVDGDGGWYRCSCVIRQTQRCFDINVLVQGFTTATTVPVSPRTTHQVGGTEFTHRKEESSESLTTIITSVSVGILLICSLVGSYIYHRRRTRRRCSHRRTRQIGMRPTGPADSMDGYEAVALPHTQGSNHHINSLYQTEDENLCTFQY